MIMISLLGYEQNFPIQMIFQPIIRPSTEAYHDNHLCYQHIRDQTITLTEICNEVLTDGI